jgi:hypothetical protein
METADHAEIRTDAAFQIFPIGEANSRTPCGDVHGASLYGARRVR